MDGDYLSPLSFHAHKKMNCIGRYQYLVTERLAGILLFHNAQDGFNETDSACGFECCFDKEEIFCAFLFSSLCNFTSYLGEV